MTPPTVPFSAERAEELANTLDLIGPYAGYPTDMAEAAAQLRAAVENDERLKRILDEKNRKLGLARAECERLRAQIGGAESFYQK